MSNDYDRDFIVSAPDPHHAPLIPRRNKIALVAVVAVPVLSMCLFVLLGWVT